MIRQPKPAYTIGLYAIIYLCLLPFYSHQINPDAVSYIACAEHYAEAEWIKAINGYWSPLLCWLLVPFIKTGIEPLFGIKIINLVFSILALMMIYRIARRYITEASYIYCLLWICIPHLLSLSLTMATPDIIALALILLFVQQLLKLIEKPTPYRVILSGIIGALCYFSKYYNFYGILLCFGIAVGYLLFTRNTPLMKYLLAACVLFIVVSLAWMCITYTKYHVFTPTTSSAYNMRLMFQPTRYPFLEGNGIKLDYSVFTYTSWEDPFYYPETGWTVYPPNQSKLIRFIKIVLVNMHNILWFYPLEILLGLVAAYMLLFKRRSFSGHIYLVLFITLAYPLGYVLTIVEQRYIFFSVAMALVLFFAVTNTIPRLQGKFAAIILLSSILVCFSAYQLWRMPPANRHYESFKPLPDLQHANIICSRTTWAEALYLCYFKNGKLNDVILPELVNNSFTNAYPGLRYYVCRPNEIPESLDKNAAMYAGNIVIVPLQNSVRP